MGTGTFEQLRVGDESVHAYTHGVGGLKAGVVVFHPWWGLNNDVMSYADRLAAAGFSVVAPDLARGLLHLAEVDPYTPDDAITAFEREIRDAGRTFDVHRYPGTGHWFAEPSQANWRPVAAELAFERTLEFLHRNLAS